MSTMDDLTLFPLPPEVGFRETRRGKRCARISELLPPPEDGPEQRHMDAVGRWQAFAEANPLPIGTKVLLGDDRFPGMIESYWRSLPCVRQYAGPMRGWSRWGNEVHFRPCTPEAWAAHMTCDAGGQARVPLGEDVPFDNGSRMDMFARCPSGGMPTWEPDAFCVPFHDWTLPTVGDASLICARCGHGIDYVHFTDVLLTEVLDEMRASGLPRRFGDGLLAAGDRALKTLAASWGTP